MNSYELSRGFIDWSFENPEKVKPIHYAIFFFSVEHCNRLGWKEKFGLPSQMVMEAIGVKNWRTYSAGLNDLVEFGFIRLVEKSSNQYSSNIIAIVNFTKADTKALDKASLRHTTKQDAKQQPKQGQSKDSIDIPNTILPNTEIPSTIETHLENKNLSSLEIEVFDLPDPFVEIWDRWIKYKWDQFKFKYKSKDSEETAKKSLLQMCEGDPDKATKILDYAIGNGYKGFFELRSNPGGQELSKEEKNKQTTLNAINHLQNKFKEKQAV